MNTFDYALELDWTGGHQDGILGLRGFDRSHQIRIAGKPVLEASADRPFRGDASRHNPEDLLLAALSSCHMLAYLHLAAREGLRVTAYHDQARGRLRLQGEAGRFTEVCLQPHVHLCAGQSRAHADALHAQAHQLCFIANSVNFPVRIAPVSTIDSL